MASPLPRECSTTELQERSGRILGMNCGVAQPLVYKRVHRGVARLHFIPKKRPNCKNLRLGAGERNRTVVISLEGFCSTIELHPQIRNFHLTTIDSHATTKSWWRGRDSNLRTRERADLQSAAINHSATSPLNPRLCRILGDRSIKARIMTLSGAQRGAKTIFLR